VLAGPAAATAAPPVPATPDPVAAGVPGHGRAWELVTPPDPVAARLVGIFNFTPLVAISAAGDQVAYRTVSSLPEAPFGGLVTFNLAVRGPGGWTNAPLAPPPHPELANPIEEGAIGFTPGFTSSLWTGTLPAGSGVALYARAADGAFSLRQAAAGGLTTVAISPDQSQVVFSSPGHLLAADAARTEGLSLYELDGSVLRLLDVGAGGTLVSTCGVTPLAASTDERAFFSARPDCAAGARIYLTSGTQATEISAPECTPGHCAAGTGAVNWAGASADGSVAFFSSDEQLIAEDTNAYYDLYRYDDASGELSLVTQRASGSTASQQAYSVRSSANGSRAYFSFEGQLLPGEGSATGPNLYLSDGQGLRFVASGVSVEQVSDDGRYALLEADASLLPGDTDSSADLYRYDAVDDKLIQVSIGPEGRGNGPLGSYPAPTIYPGEYPFVPRLGALPDLSRTLLFRTNEQLLSQDHNAESDIYEWSEAGLALLSSGVPDSEGEYFGATADAKTVLFRTTATLLPRDRDGGELDVYAARVGGGFAEPAPIAECKGDACAQAPVARPAPRRLAPGGGKPRLGFARIDAAARRQLAAKGWAPLLAESPRAGRLAAVGRARIGSRQALVARASAKAKQAGPVRLRLQLTAAARESLAHGNDLRVSLVLRLAGAKQARATHFTLAGSR
jgi:hypothetical protein